eukprot:13779616-Heterocapsa_arctica.AAC.1
MTTKTAPPTAESETGGKPEAANGEQVEKPKASKQRKYMTEKQILGCPALDAGQPSEYNRGSQESGFINRGAGNRT